MGREGKAPPHQGNGKAGPATAHAEAKPPPANNGQVPKSLPAGDGKPAADATGQGNPTPVVVRLDTVQPAAVEWLWRGWIPRRTVVLLDGDPGLGKSTIALDLAARVTRGWEMPPAGGPCEGAEPEGVLLLSAEDDLARTIRPRLDAAGADPALVWFLQAIRTADDERPPVLPWDLTLAEGMILEHDVRLVVVDPLMAYLDGNISSFKDQDVRRCMHRLTLLAHKTGAAILVIRHLNKLVGGPALYRGGGSIGIIGAVRSALLVGRDPTDSSRCVLASNKSNLGPAPKSRLYTMTPATPNVARIGCGEETDLTADDLVAKANGGRKRGQTGEALEAAVAFLERALGDGPKWVEHLAKWAKAECVSWASVKRAKKELEIVAGHDGASGRWCWRLPGQDGLPQEAQQGQGAQITNNLSPLPKNPEKQGVSEQGAQITKVSPLPQEAHERDSLAGRDGDRGPSPVERAKAAAAATGVEGAGASILMALDALDPDQGGVGYVRLRNAAGFRQVDMNRAVVRLVDDGFVQEVRLRSGKGKGTIRGLRRAPAKARQVQPAGEQDGSVEVARPADDDSEVL
jgi:hypothetical protein